MNILFLSHSETIRFYCGYDYAATVQQLFQKMQQTVDWFEHPPQKMGKTAFEIDQERLPTDEVEVLHLQSLRALNQMDTATARLSYIACLICRCVQMLVFHFMNIRMLHQNIASLSRTNRDQKGRFMSSCGFKIKDTQLKDQEAELYVLTLSNSTEVKITLKTRSQSAFVLVDLQHPKYLEIKQMKTTEDPCLQQAIGQIACELIARQENAEWIFSHTNQSALKNVGFYEVPNTAGVWKRREETSVPASPLLPGQGPFLPIRLSANI